MYKNILQKLNINAIFKYFYKYIYLYLKKETILTMKKLATYIYL